MLLVSKLALVNEDWGARNGSKKMEKKNKNKIDKNKNAHLRPPLSGRKGIASISRCFFKNPPKKFQFSLHFFHGILRLPVL